MTHMRNAPARSGRRWTACLAALALPIALASCSTTSLETGSQGTIEYPGSGAGPDAAATYIAREKDTLEGIAARFGVDRQRIVDRNRLTPPHLLRGGQALQLPGARFVADSVPGVGMPPAPAAVRATTSPPPGAAAPVTAVALPPPGSPAVAGPVPPPPESPGMVPPPSQAAALPPIGGTTRFDWPVRGRVVSGFGPRAGGQKNDGIDIAAPQGTPVKAADAGNVVYAGNEVAGMGNLVLVQHAGGYITAYAHLDEMAVIKGTTLQKGQTIGKVGSSGGAGSPQLHFEVRRQNKPVDPAPLLPAQ